MLALAKGRCCYKEVFEDELDENSRAIRCVDGWDWEADPKCNNKSFQCCCSLPI